MSFSFTWGRNSHLKINQNVIFRWIGGSKYVRKNSVTLNNTTVPNIKEYVKYI